MELNLLFINNCYIFASLNEDFRMKFVPTLEDYLKHLTLPAWIHNGVKDVENPIATQFATDLIAKLKEEEQLN
jgi:hypothetical protein